jgi:hypothetical protein
MAVLGPFPQPRPDLKRPGWIEHIVHGPVKAVVYTDDRFEDPAVQRALAAYFAGAAEALAADGNEVTWRSSAAIVQMQRSVARARRSRLSRWWQR